jgi:zinc transport system ATP-binding protein
MSPSNEPIIVLQDVDFAYDTQPVLAHVNLEILAHEFVAVIGPNGGGKTTLIKIVMGLLQPQKGTVRLFGKSAASVRGRFGYTPQHALFDYDFPVTVLDVVLMGRLRPRLSLGPFRRHDREAAMSALEEVGCASLHARPFSDLSGGQRQRVLIARALTSQPEALFLDEPSANLDPSIQDEFYALLRRLSQRMAVVIVSHDVSFVSKHVQKVVCVNREVYLHDTAELKGSVLDELYGEMGVRAVDHKHSH